MREKILEEGRLLHESQGLPPQLTLALLQIKKCTRFSNSDFQSYNVYLQQAFLSELAGRENQRYKSIKRAAELHPSARLYLELASIYKSKKDYLKMHKYNQEALKLDPKVTQISGPKPEVSVKQKIQRKDNSHEKIIVSLSQKFARFSNNGKKIQEISNNISKVENSEDLIKQINLLLEQSIPLQNLVHWVETWAALYKNFGNFHPKSTPSKIFTLAANHALF